MLYGGDLSNDSISNEFWSYNIEAAIWKKHPQTELHPVAVCQHSASVININGDQYLYIYGGRTNHSGDEGLSSDMYRFSWRQESWEKVIPDESGVKTSRLRVAGHTMVYNKVDHSFLVYGGFRMDERQKTFRTNTVYLYDITNNVWIDLQPSLESVMSSVVPDKLVFHQAVVVGNYMVVHGGNVHVHKLKEQCYGVLVYVYHLQCHTWSLVYNSDIEYNEQMVFDTGRFAHVATLMRGRVLLVHGGYSGMMTHNLLAFKLPNFITEEPKNLTRVQEICRSVYEQSSCNRHPYCVWCHTPLGNCMPITEASRSCSLLSSNKCPGICPLFKTCFSCSGHPRYKPFFNLLLF